MSVRAIIFNWKRIEQLVFSFMLGTQVILNWICSTIGRLGCSRGNAILARSGDRRPKLCGDDAECMGRVSRVMKC